MKSLDRRIPPLYPRDVVIATATRIAELANDATCMPDEAVIDSLCSTWHTLLDTVGWTLFENAYQAARKAKP